MSESGYLVPVWPAPLSVKAAVSLRQGGVSTEPYKSFNLAEHVGDIPEAVEANRARMRETLQIEQVTWLNQIHGTDSLQICSDFDFSLRPNADASWTKLKNVACAVLTADCMPILACSTEGTKIAAIHAGWRGLSNGVIARCLTAAKFNAEETLIWLGPAIGPTAYQVGEEVRACFHRSEYFQQLNVDQAFEADGEKFLCNLYQLARMHLQNRGYRNIWGETECTFTDKDRYFSYRRDGETGRMASLIWMDEE